MLQLVSVVVRRASASGTCMVQRDGYGGQVRARHRVLDEREQLSLLEPHLIGDADAELVQGSDRRGGVESERVRSVANRDVVAQRAADERMVRVSVARVRGQQHLLLQTEVRAAVLFPVAKEGGARLACRRSGGTAKLLGDEQRLVVIARQRGERRISLHRRQILAETSAPCVRASSARSPRNSIRQPAAYGSRGTNPANLVLGAMPSESCRASRVIVVASLRAALSHGNHEFRRRRIVSRRATILVVQLQADHGRHGDDAK